jgi:hypothetical protein
MESIHENGFEAIAWYQPFHKFSERQWGIYFYAPMLDSMASIFALQLRGSEPRAYEIGELLAFHLVLQHELFHARLEFAASFHELAARRAGYLSYDKNVYDHFRGSQYWKEEALANWTAMQWLLGELPRWVARGLVQSPPNVLSCIESSFAEQPDGYRHWKSGDDPRTWQFLANEFVTGRPTKTVPKRPSPIEGALRSRDLIELRERDVPLHFVGRGVIADRLFSAPSRREAVRLLKHFGYEFDETGKGSHEIWRNASGVHFSLPKNDPLSVGVFHGLLKHLALTKNKYLQEVRLKL